MLLQRTLTRGSGAWLVQRRGIRDAQRGTPSQWTTGGGHRPDVGSVEIARRRKRGEHDDADGCFDATA